MRPESLVSYQENLARHLRRPGSTRPARGLDRERTTVYRQLLRNNLASLLDPCFPVLRRELGGRAWRVLQRRFFAGHATASPYFRDVPGEFVRWLADSARERLLDEPMWLASLAHWEWVELVADIAPDAVQVAVPTLHPSLCLAAYDWPVHRLGGGGAVPRETTWLMAWRDPADRVRFAALDAGAWQALAAFDGGLPANAALAPLLPELIALGIVIPAQEH